MGNGHMVTLPPPDTQTHTIGGRLISLWYSEIILHADISRNQLSFVLLHLIIFVVTEVYWCCNWRKLCLMELIIKAY